jgi:hypothetical protein
MVMQGRTMKCQMCASLNREHSRQCEIEAAAILRQRDESVRMAKGRSSGHDPNDAELVLASRKRQMQIASELERHRAADHVA